VNEFFDLRGTFTWTFDCVMVRYGPVDVASLAALEANHYDEAPVINDKNIVVGVVPTDHLRSKFDRRSPLLPDDSSIRYEKVLVDVRPDDFLSKLEAYRSVFVARGDGEVVGLFTISDLNRHEIRSQIYPRLADLESKLASAIEDEFPDPWKWLAWLGDGAIGVVGHWEILKRNGLNLVASSGANLGQLLQVAENHENLWRQLKFPSKSKCGDFRRSVTNVRNAVMHPARPLIESHEKVRSLRKVLNMTEGACAGLQMRERVRRRGMNTSLP
jgi:hypothetical protein